MITSRHGSLLEGVCVCVCVCVCLGLRVRGSKHVFEVVCCNGFVLAEKGVGSK